MEQHNSRAGNLKLHMALVFRISFLILKEIFPSKSYFMCMLIFKRQTLLICVHVGFLYPSTNDSKNYTLKPLFFVFLVVLVTRYFPSMSL